MHWLKENKRKRQIDRKKGKGKYKRERETLIDHWFDFSVLRSVRDERKKYGKKEFSSQWRSNIDQMALRKYDCEHIFWNPIWPLH
jgi:hypothetical protein